MLGNAFWTDLIDLMKPARKRNSRFFSMLRRPSPCLDIFLCISSLSLSVRSPRSSVSATAFEIASSCCLAKSRDKWIGTAASRCWILPGMHWRRRINFSCVFFSLQMLEMTSFVLSKLFCNFDSINWSPPSGIPDKLNPCSLPM